MKQPKTKRLLAATAFLLGVFAVGGVSLTYADTSVTKTDPMSTIITTIAHKFNLSETDVKSVVDQVMQEDRAQHKKTQAQSVATRLSAAVSSGKLTQAQADLITSKLEELKSSQESTKSMTAAERKTFMDTQRTTLEAWAKENNIPTQYLFLGGGMKHGKNPASHAPTTQ